MKFKLHGSWGILIIIFLVISCGKPVRQIVQEVKVNTVEFPIDLGEVVLVTLPPGFPQKDYNSFLETLPQEIKSYGFLEVWDTDYHEMELKSVGINDFSTERNREKLFTELGVRYLLELEIVDRKYFRSSSLGATMRYNEINNNSPYVGANAWENSNYWILTRYKLFDLNQKELLIDMKVRTSHHDNNTVNPKAIKKDIQKLFEYIYSFSSR